MGMTIRSEVKISRDEAIRYLFMESGVAQGIISAVLSSVAAFFITFYILSLILLRDITTNQFLVLLVIFAGLGVLLFFIKKEEFNLYDRTHSEIFMHGVFTYPVMIILFTAIFLYFVLPQEEWSVTEVGTEASLLSSVITLMLVGLMIAYIFEGLWKLINFYVLQLFAKRDWFILAEREVFIQGMGMRFEESRRYGTALSVLKVQLDIPASRKRLLNSIYKRVVKALRDIDSISHLDNWNDFAVLTPITGPACHGLFNRVANVIKEQLYAKGVKENHKIEGYISSVTPETESEYDLLKPQEKIEHEIKFN